MRIPAVFISCAIFSMLSLSARRAASQNIPACNSGLMTRQGNAVTMGLQQLTGILDRKLSAAHSNFKDLSLTAAGSNLKVSGTQNGKPIWISGPLTVSNGAVRLHADHIVQSGTHEKALMGLFGKDLADYAHFKKTQSLSARGNSLYIHPDPLLNLSGTVKSVRLEGSSITLTFDSQPCR